MPQKIFEPTRPPGTESSEPLTDRFWFKSLLLAGLVAVFARACGLVEKEKSPAQKAVLPQPVASQPAATPPKKTGFGTGLWN